MFLHLGGDTVVLKEDIVGIFDLRTRNSPVTKEFMEIALDEGFIKDITAGGKGKSFIITTKEIFLSPISCTTLQKRSDKII